jgi:thiamine kinase-like enzyme
MNSTPLLAIDPALPQRDLLLDESLMTEYLSRLLARHHDYAIQDCARLRTKYRVGTSLRVLYEVSGANRSYRVAARAFPRTHRVVNQFTSAVSAPELNTIFWIFPHDRKIKNLTVLDEIPDELRDIEGGTWTNSRIVAHAPEKSVTAQCLDDAQQTIAYAKIYAGDEGRQIFGTYTHVAAALKTETQIPRAITYFEKHRLLLLEPVAGIALSAVTPAQSENAFFRLGKALKTLHHIGSPTSIRSSTRLTPEAIAQAAAVISQARPDAADSVHRLSTQLIAQYEAPRRRVFLHGDVHPKNILLNDDHLFLLDLDQAAIGPPEVDLGSVIAGLYCDACTGSHTARETSLLKCALLNGYDAPQTSRALRWHVAAALLQERALRSVTRVRAANLQKLPEILCAAEAVLNGGVSEN